MKYHIVFFVGKLETMDYFVHSLCAHAAALDFDYYLADVNDPVSYSSDEFYNYLQQPNTFAFLLNQIGLGLFKDGENVYSAYNVPVIDVDIYGENWISEKYPFSDNIRIHSRVSSDECNRLVGRSKISLNCMPWYKEGCSERVFNNMLNGAVCVTDVSTYLLERFEHGRELIFYNLEDLDSMADCVKYLLENPVVAKGIAKQGQLNALRNDTWRSRAKTILEYADSIMI